MLFFFYVLSFFQFKFDCDFKILYNIFFTNYRYISFLMLNFNDMGLILFCNSFLDGYTTTKMHVWTKWKSSWREKNHPFRRQCHHYQTPVTLTHSNEIHLATQWSEWKSNVTQLKGYWEPMETLSLEKKIKLLYIYELQLVAKDEMILWVLLLNIINHFLKILHIWNKNLYIAFLFIASF